MVVSLQTILTRFQKNKDFDKWVSLIEHPANPNTYAIHIKKGTFKDTVYFYGKVQLTDMGDSCRLSFETTVIENPRKHNVKSAKFTKLAGDILTYHLEQCSNGNGVIDTDYLEGANDTIIEEG